MKRLPRIFALQTIILLMMTMTGIWVVASANITVKARDIQIMVSGAQDADTTELAGAVAEGSQQNPHSKNTTAIDNDDATIVAGDANDDALATTATDEVNAEVYPAAPLDLLQQPDAGEFYAPETWIPYDDLEELTGQSAVAQLNYPNPFNSEQPQVEQSVVVEANATTELRMQEVTIRSKESYGKLLVISHHHRDQTVRGDAVANTQVEGNFRRQTKKPTLLVVASFPDNDQVFQLLL